MPDVEEKNPEPDLDELLEQFREPEEKQRRKTVPASVWLMLALILSVGGVWLALRVATGAATAIATAGPMKPGKSSERKAREEQLDAVDVVEDYIARCKKGMSAREVRWVIEDFQKAGLDQGLRDAPAGQFIRQRKAQHAWYLDLLVDGLRLDPEQKREAKEKLAGLLEEAVADFQKDLAEQASEAVEEDGRRFQVVAGAVVSRLIDSKQWLADERYAPWELCDLTDEQKRVTWFRWIQTVRTDEPGLATSDPDREWFDPDMCSLTDPASPDPGSVGDFATGQAPGKIDAAGSIFPFVSGQHFIERGSAGPIEMQAMGCHPAQLKTSLLVNPGMAARLLEGLNYLER